ncbi:hypothetical protein BU26DRAFT_275886 [Trematosphaeria pertusa]|uniref:Uncharacterized protein n=1 Tax=Trematosphaeria pertusa TaxID=390896 RepID=A0A6A6INC9_9PLEO|nr:uncharacterized protein BU26DRAFT_275886 [Trematosphaeria pertusa]KAF2251070.1 hypothetical protein BU26DRAFT_275886 [Trematosphaeria pertusa]
MDKPTSARGTETPPPPPPPAVQHRVSFSAPETSPQRHTPPLRSPTPYPSPQAPSSEDSSPESSQSESRAAAPEGAKPPRRSPSPYPPPQPPLSDDESAGTGSVTESNSDMDVGKCWACGGRLVYTGLGPSKTECVECWAPQPVE